MKKCYRFFLFIVLFFSLYPVSSCYCNDNIAFDSEGDRVDGSDSKQVKEVYIFENNNDFQTIEKRNNPDLKEICLSGQKRSCYEGSKIYGVLLPCKPGQQVCEKGRWGKCQNQVLPQYEQCNNKDDNCDGRIDNITLRQACYTGSIETDNKGLCSKGYLLCEQGQLSSCVNERTPTLEVCDQEDNNCNGMVDEGNVCSSNIEIGKEKLIKSGEFLLGSSKDFDPYGTSSTENPPVKTFLSSYKIDIYEVTNKEYNECVDSKMCTKPALPSTASKTFPKDYLTNPKYLLFPVVGVTWRQASLYCDWKKKSLPTEAQWERAAKGTIKSKPWMRYPWGEQVPLDCSYSNIILSLYKKSLDPKRGYNLSVFLCNIHPARVGAHVKDKSLQDIYDLAGNVAEWTKDCYSERFYRISKYFKDPMNVSCENGGGYSNVMRTVRGGSFRHSHLEARTTARVGFLSSQRSEYIGFRCARTIKE